MPSSRRSRKARRSPAGTCGELGRALRVGELLAGTWIKTPHPHVAEMLALSPLDVLVFDAQHAPFDRSGLDLCILAARVGGKPSS